MTPNSFTDASIVSTYRAFLVKNTSGSNALLPENFVRSGQSRGVTSLASNEYFEPQTVENFWKRKKIQHKNGHFGFTITRYGDGTFNVLYTATAKATALREVARWVKQEREEHSALNRSAPIKLGLYDVALHVSSHLDLTEPKPIDVRLVHPDDYEFTQDLAANNKREYPVFFAPSARDRLGICVPSFEKASGKQGDLAQTFILYYDAASEEFITDIDGQKTVIDIHDVYSEC